MGLTTDVLVIGGGPAGLAAAMAIRKKRFSAIVVDGAKPPIDKACGGGLLPGTLDRVGRENVALLGDASGSV